MARFPECGTAPQSLAEPKIVLERIHTERTHVWITIYIV
jgi:hypothetical protein